MKKTSISKTYTEILATLSGLAFCLVSSSSALAGTVTIVGNGAGGGPIFVTSNAGNIDIGTRVRIGTFLDLSALNNAISAFRAGTSDYSATLLALNSNFADIGTGLSNYGTVSQVANGGASFSPSTSQFGFNNLTTLTVNGTSGSYTTFNGQITSVNYSLSIGASKNLYLWTAFNQEIAIVRNANGTGTANWTTPTSDLNGVTMNLSGLQVTAGGSVQSGEVLLGTVNDFSSGNDLIRLEAVPEPSTGALMMIGAAGLVALRRLRKV
ncbi:MAG: PEP-CTERM sorting domain-containing protein [Bacteroidetes bacterium]|nr:PEP-CTERM sorting domain-containing protein [Bacteroidota bacterium]